MVPAFLVPRSLKHDSYGRRDVAADRRDGILRIEVVARAACCFRRFLRSQAAIRPQIVRGESSPGQGPFALIAPRAPVKMPSFRAFCFASSSHYKNLYRRFPLHAIVDVFQPAIIPAQTELEPVDGRGRAEIDLPMGRTRVLAMDPGPEDHLLSAPLCLRQRHVGHRRLPCP